ncbi:MAG: GtrA family protein [Pseudomonadales bacterium]
MTTVRTHFRRQILRYLQVGFAGFVADISVLALLIYGFDFGDTDAGLVVSRVVSFLAAITVTFLLNAGYTFGASVRESNFTRYVLIQSLGATINVGSYSVLVLVGPLNDAPLLALVIGSAAATTSNFILVRRFVYS